MHGKRGKGILQKITHVTNMPISISEALKKQIICGQIVGGTQLKQEEIASRFNVSLIPVREAIIQLEAQGLVECIRNKGAVVTCLSLEEMNDAFKLRGILETGAIKQAIPNMTSDDIKKLESLASKMEEETDPAKWSRLNWLFHEKLYMSAGNAMLMGVIEKLFVTIQRYSMLELILTGTAKKGNADHRDILAACKNKDLNRAAKLVEKHIESERKELTIHLAKEAEENLDK